MFWEYSSLLFWARLCFKRQDVSLSYLSTWAFQAVLVVKNPIANAGDVIVTGLIPGPERYPRQGHGNPFQCSCLENPMDRGAWRATVHGVTGVRHDWRSTQHICSHNGRKSKSSQYATFLEVTSNLFLADLVGHPSLLIIGKIISKNWFLSWKLLWLRGIL